MAETKGRKETEQPAGPDAAPAATAQSKGVNLGIRLVAGNDSDLPVVANYTALNVAPGMAFIDFGFLEPAVLTALPRVVQQGGKLPESINGKLAVRVAMGYDALANLHQQLGRVLAGASQQHASSAKS